MFFQHMMKGGSSATVKKLLHGLQIRDQWVSLAIMQPNLVRNYSQGRIEVEPSPGPCTEDALSKFLPSEVYKKHLCQFEAKKNILETGRITSVEDLVATCQLLHSMQDEIEKPNSKVVDSSYKARGFLLPRHMRYWFRGHVKKQFRLIPSLFRAKNQELATKEDLMIKEFMLKNNIPSSSNVFSILAKMQHYGYPTRLLDWSSNIMTAAYFAC